MFCIYCGVVCTPDANCCLGCGQRTDLDFVVENSRSSVDELIRTYFHRGYPYHVIVGLLEKRDGIQMHVRTFQRKFTELGLKRKYANYASTALA